MKTEIIPNLHWFLFQNEKFQVKTHSSMVRWTPLIKKKFEYSPIYVHFYEVGGENDTFPRSLQFKLLLKSIELFCSS